MVCRLVCIEARRRVGAPMELRRRADKGGAGVATEDLFILNTFIFLVGLQAVPGTDVELENYQRGDSRPRAKKTPAKKTAVKETFNSGDMNYSYDYHDHPLPVPNIGEVARWRAIVKNDFLCHDFPSDFPFIQPVFHSRVYLSGKLGVMIFCKPLIFISYFAAHLLPVLRETRQANRNESAHAGALCAHNLETDILFVKIV